MSKPPNNVLVATIAGLFGVHGELKCDPTPAGAPILAPGASFEVRVHGASRLLTIATIRPHARRLLVRFDGFDDPVSAQTLVGAELHAPAHAIALAPDEYLDADLIGCRLVDPSGRELGGVVDVAHYPAQDCLLVGESRAIVPLVKAFVRRVDIAGKRIDVDLPVGLMDASQAEEA